MEPLLEIDDLTVTFPGRRRLLPRRPTREFTAVQGVASHIDVGETLGLVGESGSGKTTLGRAVLGFVPSKSGTIRLGSFDVTRFGRSVPLPYRKAVQVVFQDPIASLNPSMIVRDLVSEPLQIHFDMAKAARHKRAAELVDQVGLQTHHLNRYPYEFSGGQRQRIAIARALASEPELVVLDEPVAALDVSTQSQVINLLERLQRETGTAYLLIAHDIAVVRHASRRIAVMYRSRIVEEGPSDRVCEEPAHPYTELLLASIPNVNPSVQSRLRRRRRELTVGNPESESDPGVGCPFAHRCPHVMDVCRSEFPRWADVPGGGRVACHLYVSASLSNGTTALDAVIEGAT